MKASLRFIILALALGLCLATRTKSKTKTHSRNKRRSSNGPPTSTPPNGDAAEPGPPIKLDSVGLFVPETPANMDKKPQIIIQRDGLPNPSEAYHDQLRANEPCKLMQGYVLVQTSINTKCKIFCNLSCCSCLDCEACFCCIKQTIDFLL